MEYLSTRGAGTPVTASEAILKGLSADGGLYVPDTIPTIDERFIESLLPLSYQERAKKILALYLTDYSAEEIDSCVNNAYSTKKFDTPAIAPVVELDESNYILELWHGPTSAFKDMALQILPQFISTSLKKVGKNEELVILVATSGDTGKAALDGFKDVNQTKIIVFYPQDGVSDIQKAQMVTQEGKNVSVVAIKGNFDDAQTGVKKIFNDSEYAQLLQNNKYQLSSANSINWGRLLPQIIYYFSAYADLVNTKSITLGEKINFTVPTGNFGDILAGYYARCMGLPINKLVCASNSNNVLTDFLITGCYDRNRDFHKTISPSMDILISSNLERLLYHMTNNPAQVKAWMEELNVTGSYTVDDDTLAKIQSIFAAGYADDNTTQKAIKEVYDKYNYVMDTHTAVAWKIAEKYSNANEVMVVLSTASPYKFNDSVLVALGEDIAELDAFTMLESLSKLNPNPIPNGLAKLKTATVLHDNICSKEDMLGTVSKFLQI